MIAEVKKAMEYRLQRAQIFIFGTAFYFEVFAAVCTIAGLVITFVDVPRELLSLAEGGSFLAFLTFMFNIIIGIELLKMFCRHNLDSVVEVLLFAMARQVIIEHNSMTDNLLCMIAVALLFVIRKFLFVSALDANQPVFQAADPGGQEQPHSQTAEPGGSQAQTGAAKKEPQPKRFVLERYSRNSFFE